MKSLNIDKHDSRLLPKKMLVDPQVESKNTRKQLLKSTGIIGGSQVIIILVGMIRTKIVAVLLGPTGVGISGLYQSSLDLIRSATNLGIQFSSVRDIAASDDEVQLSRVITIMKRWLWFTGIVGSLAVLLLCKPLSRYAFGNYEYAWGFAVLSATILMAGIASGYFAILSGLRKVPELAKANITGTVVGFLVTIPFYIFFKEKGIVPAIFSISVVGLIIPWFYTRKLRFTTTHVSLKSTLAEGHAMIKLGLVTVITGFTEMGTMYVVRIFVGDRVGLDGVGFFIAAWSISTMYMSMVINAMGADFFPRLSALQNDRKSLNKIVNDQTEITILVAAPLIIGMLSFINLLVHVFYSNKFGVTASILNWQLLGDFFKVLLWPISMLFMASRISRAFLLVNILFNGLYLLGIILGWSHFGIQVTGIAFTVSFIIVLFIGKLIARVSLGFKWSPKVRRNLVFFTPLVILAFLCSHYLHQTTQFITGAIITLTASVLSIVHLNKIINFKNLFNSFSSSKVKE